MLIKLISTGFTVQELGYGDNVSWSPLYRSVYPSFFRPMRIPEIQIICLFISYKPQTLSI